MYIVEEKCCVIGETLLSWLCWVNIEEITEKNEVTWSAASLQELLTLMQFL